MITAASDDGVLMALTLSRIVAISTDGTILVGSSAQITFKLASPPRDGYLETLVGGS